MIKYLHDIIEEFPGVIAGRAATPAAYHLFNVRDGNAARVLEEERALAFCHTVAQLLFMAMRARQDIQTQLHFLQGE
jgi:hypothetical protein